MQCCIGAAVRRAWIGTWGEEHGWVVEEKLVVYVEIEQLEGCKKRRKKLDEERIFYLLLLLFFVVWCVDRLRVSPSIEVNFHLGDRLVMCSNPETSSSHEQG